MSVIWRKPTCEEIQNAGIEALIQQTIYIDGNGNAAFLTITPDDVPDIDP